MTHRDLIRIFAVFNIIESIVPLGQILRHFSGRTTGVPLVVAYVGAVLLLWLSAYGIWRCRKWGLYLILLQSAADILYRLPSLIAWVTFLGKPIRDEFYFSSIEVFFLLLAVVKIVFFSQSKTRRHFSQLTQTT